MTLALTGSALAQSSTDDAKPQQYVATARQPNQEPPRQAATASARSATDEAQVRQDSAQQEWARQEFLKQVWTAP